MKLAGVVSLLLLALSCSCLQGGSTEGAETPEQGIVLEPLNISTAEDGTVTVLYRHTAEDCMCTSEPHIAGPDPEVWTVTVNDFEAPVVGGRYYIGGLAHEGENVIEIHGSGNIPRVHLVTNNL